MRETQRGIVSHTVEHRVQPQRALQLITAAQRLELPYSLSLLAEETPDNANILVTVDLTGKSTTPQEYVEKASTNVPIKDKTRRVTPTGTVPLLLIPTDIEHAASLVLAAEFMDVPWEIRTYPKKHVSPAFEINVGLRVDDRERIRLIELAAGLTYRPFKSRSQMRIS